MYCKYCGKELTEGGKFCGFCGKNQESPPISENAKSQEPWDTKALMFTIISIISELVCIIMMLFLDLCKISVGSGYYSADTKLGIFDLLENADSLTSISGISDSVDRIVGGLIGFGVVLLIMVVICSIYYIYYILSYTFAKNSHLKTCFGAAYNNYSIVPNIFFIIASGIGMIAVSCQGEYISVAPSVPMVFIYIITAFQLIINRYYDYSWYR